MSTCSCPVLRSIAYRALLPEVLEVFKKVAYLLSGLKANDPGKSMPGAGNLAISSKEISIL